jgi:hypothetical protein
MTPTEARQIEWASLSRERQGSPTLTPFSNFVSHNFGDKIRKARESEQDAARCRNKIPNPFSSFVFPKFRNKNINTMWRSESFLAFISSHQEFLFDGELQGDSMLAG